jgi:Ca-activated chloride channel homolog
LLDKPQQVKALQYGFRPSDSSIAIGAPLDGAHGVDPGQPKTLLQVPTADVVRSIEASWNGERRKVDVMLILDRSGSMDEQIGGLSKLRAAKQGLKQFVSLLSDGDSVGLTVFGDNADVISPVSQLGPNGSDADASGLTKIASATGGQEYTGTPQNIQQVFVQISEFF